jgi:hypothetical protein
MLGTNDPGRHSIEQEWDRDGLPGWIHIDHNDGAARYAIPGTHATPKIAGSFIKAGAYRSFTSRVRDLGGRQTEQRLRARGKPVARYGVRGTAPFLVLHRGVHMHSMDVGAAQAAGSPAVSDGPACAPVLFAPIPRDLAGGARGL